MQLAWLNHASLSQLASVAFPCPDKAWSVVQVLVEWHVGTTTPMLLGHQADAITDATITADDQQ